jgi:hypothetical protein
MGFFIFATIIIKNKMEAKINSIKCPDCGIEINVDENLAAIFDKKYKKEFLEQLKVEQQILDKKIVDLKIQNEKFASLKTELSDLIEKVENKKDIIIE